jgi:hypothetical protein
VKLQELLNERDLRAALEGMLDPLSAQPPKEKGRDAILVHGYFVHGHWRRRVFSPPSTRRLRLLARRA